jgi:hypothetical protein
MGGEFLTMSALERERASVLRQVAARLITQETAGELLGLSVRQVKRLYRVWKRLGDAGLVSRQRGRVSPRRMEASLRGRIETLLKAKYPDFGPTLAAEKLCELERIDVSREAVRRIQVALGLARVRRRRAKRVHSPRERRPRFGELIQIDASPHDWFEGRGPRCALIVFIDDATSRLTALQFSPTETTVAYLCALRAHVLAHGVPLAFYSDRNGIFRVNAKEAESGDGFTQFGRVAERVKIELIQASTPQAKGRVERANQTLQDRLIKEMRLRGVSDIPAAQAFAREFMEIWNDKFAKPPLDSTCAHRPWTAGAEALEKALARREQRVLSKALTFSVGGKVFCVKTNGPGTALRGARVTILHFLDGTMRVEYKDRSLLFTHFKTNPGPKPAEDEKTIDARMAELVEAHAQPSRPTTVVPQGCG